LVSLTKNQSLQNAAEDLSLILSALKEDDGGEVKKQVEDSLSKIERVMKKYSLTNGHDVKKKKRTEA
jgi:hypothetical protein